MKRLYSRIIAAAVLAVMMIALAGCGGEGNTNSSFEPDLTDTEWLAYRVTSAGSYVTSADYVFTQDRVEYLEQDVEYSLHTGEEAYTEAYITEEDAEALYSEDAFDEDDEKGGFVTIILHYENGKDGMYGWMNKAMDKMVLTDPYDGAGIYFFRKDTEASQAYEKNVEPLFESFLKQNLTKDLNETIRYADRTVEHITYMELMNDASEEAAKSKQVVDTLEGIFDQYADQGAELAASLESMICLDGIKVKEVYIYGDELIGSATYDKSGEIKEERFLYGR